MDVLIIKCINPRDKVFLFIFWVSKNLIPEAHF